MLLKNKEKNFLVKYGMSAVGIYVVVLLLMAIIIGILSLLTPTVITFWIVFSKILLLMNILGIIAIGVFMVMSTIFIFSNLVGNPFQFLSKLEDWINNRWPKD